jgi:predicted DNA-binding transcriptional regulator
MSEREGAKGSEEDRFDSVKGTTLRVYRFIYKSGREVRINDVQRALGLSSPSVAEYHIKKLLGFGLIKEERNGYVVDRVIWSNIIRFRRTSIPIQAAYATFFVASLVVMLTLFRPPAVTASYFFVLLVISVGIFLSVYEGHKTLSSL